MTLRLFFLKWKYSLWCKWELSATKIDLLRETLLKQINKKSKTGYHRGQIKYTGWILKLFDNSIVRKLTKKPINKLPESPLNNLKLEPEGNKFNIRLITTGTNKIANNLSVFGSSIRIMV